jgi:hypothetical protein
MGIKNVKLQKIVETRAISNPKSKKSAQIIFRNLLLGKKMKNVETYILRVFRNGIILNSLKTDIGKKKIILNVLSVGLGMVSEVLSYFMF